MPRNPMLSNRDAQNTSIGQGNSVNDSHKSYLQRKNRFNLSYPQFQTERFGDVTPHFVMNAVGGDIVPFGSREEIRSFTMKSPILSDIRHHKSYFAIPMESILPKTWELIYANPTKGDDVPDDAYCLTTLPYILLTKFRTYLNSGAPTADPGLHYLLALESVFSDGSLLSYLGLPLSALFNFSLQGVSQNIIDYMLNQLFNSNGFANNLAFLVTNSDGESIYYTANPQLESYLVATYDTDVRIVSYSYLLSILRESPNWEVVSGSADYDLEENWLLYLDLINNFFSDNFLAKCLSSLKDVSGNPILYDFSRLYAYQLACSAFMSDDSIDYIYSAKLFRENFASIVLNEVTAFSTFNYNGVSVQYDYFSKHLVDDAIQGSDLALFSFCSLICGFRKSLRFQDYFTGAKPQPLAVGDVNAPVTGEGVSAIDVNRSLLRQRFLNQINRVGQRFSDYVKEMFGTNVLPDKTEPKFLADQINSLRTSEIENTGDAQVSDNATNTVTSVVRSSGSDYCFEVSIDEPCILLGVSWYDIPRLYSYAIDRFYFHKDRYDMFNKFYQYAGDQDINAKELNISQPDTPFAYTLRYMEYKQSIPRAVGGFVHELPSWSFVFDGANSDRNGEISRINSDFIRSNNSDLDQFYASLNGRSLSSYFHFICRYHNMNNCVRQMEYAPSQL